MTVFLEFLIENSLNVLPNGIAVRPQDEQTLDAGIIDKLRLGANIGKPLGKILLHVGYLLNFFLFCHYNFSFSVGSPSP